MNDANTTRTFANNGEQTETGAQLRERLGVNVRAFQAMWKRKLGYSFDANKECSRTEIEMMESSYAGRIVFANTEPSPKLDQPAVTQEKPVWPLLLVMVLAAGASVPNMYSVAFAVKENWILATLFTAAFTAAPFLLIFAGVSGIASIIGVLVVILTEVFCNTAAIYGGLTGLNHALYIKPTNFLNMATGFAFDSQYEATARGIALFMALGIAALMSISVWEIKKR